MKQANRIKIPKARKLPSGSWNIYLDKEKVSVTAPTQRECERQAMGIRTGYLIQSKAPTCITLGQCVEQYINERDSVLSASTINGYRTIARTRFRDYWDTDIDQINYQQMVNDEAKIVSARTVSNAWLLVASALKKLNKSVSVRLPKPQNVDLAFLDAEQIPLFLNAIKGRTCELGALLMLNGLRRSEALAVTPEKIQNGYIIVDSALVKDEVGYRLQNINKTKSSTRKVPILFPRIEELTLSSDCAPNTPLVKMTPNRLYDRINEACARAGVPNVGCHGLRRSFASYCAKNQIPLEICAEWGGWDDYETMSKIYTKYSERDRVNYIEKLKSELTQKI